MKYSDDTLNILAVLTYKGVGPAWVVKNLVPLVSQSQQQEMTLPMDSTEPCEFDAETIVKTLNDKVPPKGQDEDEYSLEGFREIKAQIESELENIEGVDGATCVSDPDFPKWRGEVGNDQPLVLFYKGDLSLLKPEKKAVAVIGHLNPDENIKVAEDFVVDKLVEKGAVIVSGLALGCDTIAHEQALKSGGKTVAILPSPISSVLPDDNAELADEIVKNGGLLISEYYKPAAGMELPGRFVKRDRLQAMFSDCVILAASYAENKEGNDSGSRHALEKSKKYGIKRAVIWNKSITDDDKQYDLNSQIQREDGDDAIVITGGNYESEIGKIWS
jgi:DNA processing protein